MKRIITAILILAISLVAGSDLRIGADRAEADRGHTAHPEQQTLVPTAEQDPKPEEDGATHYLAIAAERKQQALLAAEADRMVSKKMRKGKQKCLTHELEERLARIKSALSSNS